MSVLKHKEDGQWKQVSNATQTKVGNTNPTTATIAEAIGQPYLNVTTGSAFICSNINNGVYTWIPISGDNSEKLANRVTSFSGTGDDSHYPTTKAVVDYVATQLNTHITSKISEEY